MFTLSSQIQINAGAKIGPLFESDSNKRRGPKWGHYLSHPGPLLTSDMRPLDRYGTHQKTISRRPEQMYSPLTQNWEWLGERHYLRRSRINAAGAKLRLLFKSFPGPLLKSGMGPLARCSNHQEIINRRPEQIHTSFDTRLEWPREGPLLELDLNKRRGSKRGHYSSQLLGHYRSQA